MPDLHQRQFFVQILLLIFLVVSCSHVCFFLIGELPKGILCILTNVTTSKQRRLLQDTVKHGHSTCTRGHTGECSNLNNFNFNGSLGVCGFDSAINCGFVPADNLTIELSDVYPRRQKRQTEMRQFLVKKNIGVSPILLIIDDIDW